MIGNMYVPLLTPQKLQENLSPSLVYKSIKAISNFLLEIRGLITSFFSIGELVVHESSELNLQSCRRCLACFFPRNDEHLGRGVILYHNLLFMISNKFLKQNFPRRVISSHILFLKGKWLINWGVVIESKMLESTALMCKNSIDSIFPWLAESVF